MSEALSLFDVGQPSAAPDKPRCRMCVRPARWLANQQRHAMYCSGGSCTNRDRLCQNCGSTFHMNANGAGTRYCSTDCKTDGYRPHVVNTIVKTCAWCAEEAEASRRQTYPHWPFICQSCLAPLAHVLQRLRAHHVPHERVRRLVDDPGCEVCGTDILTPTHDSRTARDSAQLVVDHDHRCCPRGHYSCGNCVRGLLCSRCNSAAGMLRDDVELARSLADYLTKHQ